VSFSLRVPADASMLRRVAAAVEFYQQVLSAFPDAESLTVLVASGATRDDVLAGLGADMSEPVEDACDISEHSTAWAAIEVPGGGVAVEMTGYGDPSPRTLANLSKAGTSAVVRSNIQAHFRFGCTRAGEIVFDDDEFIYVDPASVPAELRRLFDNAWVDLDDEDEDVSEDPFPTGPAMAELVTGVELSEDLVAAVLEADFFSAPSLRYPPAEDGEEADDDPPAPVKLKLDPGVRRVADERAVWTGDGTYMLTSYWDYTSDQEACPEGVSEGFDLTVPVFALLHRCLGDRAQCQDGADGDVETSAGRVHRGGVRRCDLPPRRLAGCRRA